MARMSSEKRIELGTKMIERWRAQGMQTDRSVRFVSDMIVRMQRGKGMTTRQRAWYDTAVVAAPPAPKNVELVAQIKEACAVPGMEDLREPLTDFGYKLSKGWDLSEKQTAFMMKLLKKADDFRKNGPWVPNEEQAKEIRLGLQLAKRWNSYYLNGRPGDCKAIRKCAAWLHGEVAHADEWSANKVMGFCKGERARLKDAAERWPIGGLAETKRGVYRAQPGGSIGLVLGVPTVDDDGNSVLNVMIDGRPQNVRLDDLVKPRKTRKKKS